MIIARVVVVAWRYSESRCRKLSDGGETKQVVILVKAVRVRNRDCSLIRRKERSRAG
jgi:hypothetical protein